MKIKAALILSLITLLLVTACSLFWPRKTELPPLKFAYPAWVGYYPIVIAQEKGFFTQQGVNVQTIYLGADEPQLANLVAGKYDGIATTL
jgi:NitT/TauT family transport system substrate-binding protein